MSTGQRKSRDFARAEWVAGWFDGAAAAARARRTGTAAPTTTDPDADYRAGFAAGVEQMSEREEDAVAESCATFGSSPPRPAVAAARPFAGATSPRITTDRPAFLRHVAAASIMIAGLVGSTVVEETFAPRPNSAYAAEGEGR